MPDTQPPPEPTQRATVFRPLQLLGAAALAGLVLAALWPQGHAAFCQPRYVIPVAPVAPPPVAVP